MNMDVYIIEGHAMPVQHRGMVEHAGAACVNPTKRKGGDMMK